MYIGNSGSASVQPGVLLINMQFHKNPYLPHGGSLEILKGMGWGLKSQDMKPNWNFQRAFLSGGGGGKLKQKKPPWEGYGYFLKQHNGYQQFARAGRQKCCRGYFQDKPTPLHVTETGVIKTVDKPSWPVHCTLILTLSHPTV